MDLNTEQRTAFDLIMQGQSVFLTGQAGTGKSYLLSHVVQKLSERGKIVGVTSTTGVSALLIGGTTIHRWSGIRLGELDKEPLYQRATKNGFARKNWKQTSILIIDEVSMLTPDTLEKLDYVARNMRHSGEPFGGLQLILTGDFCQLPPVKTDVFCFQSQLWPQLIHRTIELTQVMRQTDKEFQQILGEIRMGVVTERTRQVLESRLNVDVSSGDIKPTKLYSHRKTVDEINKQHLEEIMSEENHPRVFIAHKTIASDYQIDQKRALQHMATLDKSCQARDKLVLAIGAQVMLLHNLFCDEGLVNGSRGVVIGFEEQRPVVRFMNGLELVIKAHLWELQINEKITARKNQIPLILAWATTIHKSQGSTLDCVQMDLGSSIFEYGQFYTALSRAKSLEVLSLSDLDFDSVRVHPDAEEFYRKLRNSN